MPASSFEREVWARLIEPGDEAAGYLIDSLGAPESLALVDRASPRDLLRELASVGAIDEGSSRFGNLEAALTESLQRWRPRMPLAKQLAGLRASNGYSYSLITNEDDVWPTQLNDLGWAAPPALWVRGDICAFEAVPSWIAIVGTRAATPYGASVTRELVRGLDASGIGIVSGGAYGIDTLAHSVALEFGVATAAVMAGGIDRPYPLGNRDLLDKVATFGAIISEVPPGTAPTKWRFLQRNRLIAALSACTVVVEAGWRSGSINTANHAEQLGRAIGSIPGSVLDASSAGSNRLIASGQAQLVTDASDVLSLAGIRVGSAAATTGRQQPLFESGGGPLETRALDALTTRAVKLSTVASSAGLTAAEASIALANLQLAGAAVESNGRWRRVESSL
ncbi:MAG: hypothetical protein RLZZ626_875 [Actinomycetota bacterium]